MIGIVESPGRPVRRRGVRAIEFARQTRGEIGMQAGDIGGFGRIGGQIVELDRPVEDVTRMLRLNERISSVDTPIGGDSDKALLDVIADENDGGPERRLQDADIQESIVQWLGELTPKHREVLARRFGLLGYEPSTLEDVGREIGLTRERVRQIQVEALRRLRDMLGSQGLSVDTLFRT